MDKTLPVVAVALLLIGTFLWFHILPDRQSSAADEPVFDIRPVIASGIYDGKVIFAQSDPPPGTEEGREPNDPYSTSTFYFEPAAVEHHDGHKYQGEGYTVVYPAGSQVVDQNELNAIKIILPIDKTKIPTTIQITRERSEQSKFNDFASDLQKHFLAHLAEKPIDSRYFFFDYRYETLSSGQNALLHQRNFYSFTGQLYNMMVWLGEGEYLSFSGEGNFQALGLVYSSVSVE